MRARSGSDQRRSDLSDLDPGVLEDLVLLKIPEEKERRERKKHDTRNPRGGRHLGR